MIPYANSLWHWFGRGQLVLLVANHGGAADGFGDEWMRVAWC